MGVYEGMVFLCGMITGGVFTFIILCLIILTYIETPNRTTSENHSEKGITTKVTWPEEKTVNSEHAGPRARVDAIVSRLPWSFTGRGPDGKSQEFTFPAGRLYENVCPDCGNSNGGGIVNEATPLSEDDPYSPCQNPCRHCGKGPMKVRFVNDD